MYNCSVVILSKFILKLPLNFGLRSCNSNNQSELKFVALQGVASVQFYVLYLSLTMKCGHIAWVQFQWSCYWFVHRYVVSLNRLFSSHDSGGSERVQFGVGDKGERNLVVATPSTESLRPTWGHCRTAALHMYVTFVHIPLTIKLGSCRWLSSGL
jgi:hypothetical protein